MIELLSVPDLLRQNSIETVRIVATSSRYIYRSADIEKCTTPPNPDKTLLIQTSDRSEGQGM